MEDVVDRVRASFQHWDNAKWMNWYKWLPNQAEPAVSAMLDYLTARLPSPLVGRIREQLGEVPGARRPDVGKWGVK